MEKATELGVAAVRFVATEREARAIGAGSSRACAASLSPRSSSAAVPVAGALRRPPFADLPSLLEDLPGDCCSTRRRPLPCPPTATSPRSWSVRRAGWSDAERELSGPGCRSVSLGERVLRVETAALAGAALALLPPHPRVDTPWGGGYHDREAPREVNPLKNNPFAGVRWVWMNGELVEFEKATVHVMAHALHYGSGLFEGIRCYKTPAGPAVFRLQEHLKRLENSCKVYRMQIPYTREEMTQAVFDAIRANGLEECYIRPIVYRGFGTVGINPLKAPVDVAIAVWPWGNYLGEDAPSRASTPASPPGGEPGSAARRRWPRRRPTTSTPSWSRWRR